MGIREDIRAMKDASPYLAASANEERCAALHLLCEKLENAKADIFAENEKDLARAKEEHLSDAIVKRLKFNEDKLKDCVAGIKALCEMEDPVGHVTLKRELDEGLVLTRISVPIGVIGVIFEARPDALIQISALCIRSGNCAVLKGGKETMLTNRILFSLVSEAVKEASLPAEAYVQAESHAEIDELLGMDGLVDLLIPRGSNAFVRYIMEHTKIPVMGHADGICHIYVERSADMNRALDVIADAKLQYTAACNAVETILVERAIAEEFLPRLAKRLKNEGVTLHANAETARYLLADTERITDETYVEYLDLAVSVKLVEDTKEAVAHINRYGSHHTDAILTEDDTQWETFRQLTDSAGVYRNCSTRFADGFRYGFGAEVGISTGKLHARGPVGLEGLMTCKYLLEGQGQIVGDYASGKRAFHFREVS